nr:MAG: glycoprotein [Wufeng shrew rhabdovirus 6]
MKLHLKLLGFIIMCTLLIVCKKVKKHGEKRHYETYSGQDVELKTDNTTDPFGSLEWIPDYRENKTVGWFDRSNIYQFVRNFYPEQILFSAQKTKISEREIVICEALNHFRPIEPTLLECGGARKAVDKVNYWKFKVLSASRSMVDITGCLCTSTMWHRRCSQNFVGQNWKEENKWTVKPKLDECFQVCSPVLDGTTLTHVVGGKPEWHCWWMKNENTYATETQGSVISGTYSVIFNQYRSSYCPKSLCEFWKLNYVESGDSIIIIKTKERLKKDLPKLELEDLNCEHTPLHDPWQIYGLAHLYNPSVGAFLEYGNCTVTDVWGRSYTQTTNGLFLYTDRDAPKCKDRLTTPSIPSSVSGSGLPRKEELIADLRECLLTKQVITNTQLSNHPLDPGLMKSLNHLNSQPGEYGYVLYNKTLMRGRCTSEIVDGITHSKGDIWLMTKRGKAVGCLDSRLDLVFVTSCIADTDEPTVMQALGMFEFVRSEGGVWEAVETLYSPTAKIQALEDISLSIKEYHDSISKPGTAVIPGLSNGTNTVPPTNQDGTSNWNLPIILGGTFGTLFTCIWLGVLIWCCCKCCKAQRNGYSRIALTPSTPA